jgi:ppGpp synthetase/RelA/SpoT-type nucleotidyltranferase
MNPITELYIDLQPIYQAYGEKLYTLLVEKLEKRNIYYHKLEWRVKDPVSVEEKIKRKPYKIETLTDVTDLIAFRIICYWEDEIPAIMSMIQSEFSYDANRSAIGMSLELTRANYKSVYYSLVLTSNDLERPQFVSSDRIWFEVQIMSIIQYVGAELQYQAISDNNIAIPYTSKKRLGNISSLLQVAEKEFVLARADIAENEKKMLFLFNKVVKEMSDETPLDLASLISFVIDNDFIQTIDKRLVEHLFNEYKEDFTLLDSYVDRVNFMGITTLKELCLLLFQHNKKLVLFDFALKQNSVLPREFISSGNYLGISIGTLCAMLLAQKGDLEFTKQYFSKFWKNNIPDDTELFYTKLTEALWYTEREMKRKYF